MEETKVKDVMTRGVLTIHEKASVRKAVGIMADCDISGLVVTSSTDAVTGVLSEMDIIKVLDEELDEVKIEEIMTSPAISITEQETLRRACQIMKENNIHRLVIEAPCSKLEGIFDRAVQRLVRLLERTAPRRNQCQSMNFGAHNVAMNSSTLS